MQLVENLSKKTRAYGILTRSFLDETAKKMRRSVEDFDAYRKVCYFTDCKSYLINLILANDSSEVLSKKANQPLGNSYDGNPATTNSRDS